MPDEQPPGDPRQPQYSPKADQKVAQQTQKMHLDAGWIGRIIGSPKNAANNAAFAVVVLLIVGGTLVSCLQVAERLEIWKIIIPAITAYLGYLFGTREKS